MDITLENVDWERRGYNDYPRHDLYPTRDKHSVIDEQNYLTGWHKKLTEENGAKLLQEIFGLGGDY